jgi:tetratricopeptide (TPR) repeat protein
MGIGHVVFSVLLSRPRPIVLSPPAPPGLLPSLLKFPIMLSSRTTGDRTATEVEVALHTVESSPASSLKKTEMLVEIAMGLQNRPRSVSQLEGSLTLYRRALSICPAEEPLLRARTLARMATALRTIPPGPDRETEPLVEALEAIDQAAPVLETLGLPEEIAELAMNRGLVLQALSGMGRARIQDAILSYQRALKVFDRQRFPKEFAILHNNLATAFLAVAPGGSNSQMSEALAVSSFEEGLRAVSFTDHPVEYAMLQNNLGNALQSVTSSHSVANSVRALHAYDEALRVRTRKDMPLEYANTLANRATCLWGMPDDPENPESSNIANLVEARRLLADARDVFLEHGEMGKVRSINESIVGLDADLAAAEKL